jgi:hypothetical protein
MSEVDDSNSFDTASVWRAAQHRRAQDLAGWLGSLPVQRKANSEERTTAPLGQPQTT